MSGAEPTDRLIGDVAKNSRGDVLRVQVRTFKGATFVDIRQHFPGDDGQLRATTKGVTLAPDKVAQLIELLERAK